MDNIELNEAERKERKIILKSKPRILMLVLTTNCNLSCIMCARTRYERNSTIPYTSIKQICSLFPYLEAIDWQGGEVFLVDYFRELFLEAAKFKNIRQSIVTNGLLIDENWANLFAQIRANLTYSIDATTKETYEYIRKGGKFKDLIRSLQIVNEINRRYNDPIQLHINVVVMKSNYKQLDLFPKFCKEYGVKHLRFDFLRPDVAPEEDILINSDSSATEYLKGILPEIEKESKELNIWFEYTFKPFLNDSSPTQDNKIYNSYNLVPSLKCKLPWKKLFIDACSEGDVRPDCLCEHKVGNINEESLDSIWNNKIMQFYRQRLIDNHIQGWCSTTCLKGALDCFHLEGCC